MSPYSQHRHRHRRRFTRIIRKHGQALKFCLYFAVLVLIMIGNNYASYRNDTPSNSMNNGKGDRPHQQNDLISDAQGPVNQISQGRVSSPGSEARGEGGAGLLLGSVWNDQDHVDGYYIQSAFQNRGPQGAGDYLPGTEGSHSGNQYGFGETRLGSFSSLPDQETGGHSWGYGGYVPNVLQYPHVSNNGSSGSPLSPGGSLGSTSSGGGNSSIPKNNENGPVPTPEPSTLTLAAIGLLLLARLHVFVGRASNTK